MLKADSGVEYSEGRPTARPDLIFFETQRPAAQLNSRVQVHQGPDCTSWASLRPSLAGGLEAGNEIAAGPFFSRVMAVFAII